MNHITLRFPDDTIGRCDEIRAAADRGEAHTVQILGNDIKCGAARLALDEVRNLAAALEALGRNTRIDPMAAMVDLLESELASARRAVVDSAPQPTCLP
ncbi:MAG: hypothetical protein HY271_17290 [Deltaproteobacteria bacterium]|nr:hypothetical protein [Deltaproteobacteria bacterium]